MRTMPLSHEAFNEAAFDPRRVPLVRPLDQEPRSSPTAPVPIKCGIYGPQGSGKSTSAALMAAAPHGCNGGAFHMKTGLTSFQKLVITNRRLAKHLWGPLLNQPLLLSLAQLSMQFGFSLAMGDILLLQGRWYVTHTGLIRLATRTRCAGIHVRPVPEFSDSAVPRWAFEATVYKSRACRGFVGYGDADPSNVSSLVLGAEMRVAETRAVNRALRKAYGIGICSVEEIGPRVDSPPARDSKKLPPQPANGNYGGPKVRDRLCQIIRKHELDAALVKSYATDFCRVKTLREATREQVENFVQHLADCAEKDRSALLCQLNSYLPGKEKEGVA